MKPSILLFIFSSYLLAGETLSITPMFNNYFKGYTSLKTVATKGIDGSFYNLKNGESTLSIVRSDILFFLQTGVDESDKKGDYDFKWKDYFKWKKFYLIGRTDQDSYLYFVGRDGDSHISKVEDFRGKKISIGLVEDMAGLYLKEILQKTEGVEIQVHTPSYDLEESLALIESGELDFLFAFGTERFAERVELSPLVSLELPERFKQIILKNGGFIDTKKGIKAENYIVVSDKVTPDSLVSVVKEFHEKGVLLSKVDTRLGSLHPSGQEILARIGGGKNTKRLISDIDSLYSRLSPTITSIRSKVLSIKSKSSQLKKRSQVSFYQAKADSLRDSIDSEKKILELKSQNFERWKEEKDISSLERLRNELESMNINLMGYDTKAEEIKREIKIELLREVEDAEERALQDAKEEELRMNRMPIQQMPIPQNYPFPN